MDEIVLTNEDNNSEIHLDVGDNIKIILTENAGTGYTWEINGELPKELELIFNDYKLTYKKALGGSGKRVFEFNAIHNGEVVINLKYWQEWNGSDSIEKTFTTTLFIE